MRARVDSRGRVTIPKRIRDAAGLLPGTPVELEPVADGVCVRRLAQPVGERGWRAVESLRRKGGLSMSTDELMVLLRGDDMDAR